MAEIKLKTKIQYLKGVGPKMGVKLNKLGINIVEDLLHYYPRRYEDYTQITKIKDLGRNNNQETITKQIPNIKHQIQKARSYKLEATSYTIRARVVGIANKKTRRRGFTVTEAVVEDGTGSLKVVWFNQPYLVKMLKTGSEIILNGKVSVDQYSHQFVMESPNRANKPKIVPIYGETAGLSSHYIAKLVLSIGYNVSGIREFLPEKAIKQNKLLGIQQAILNIHQPENSEMLRRAEERIAFDELLMISIRAQLSKASNQSKIGPRIQIENSLLKEFTAKLPFELTKDQKISAWKIISDIKKDQPMNRLLNGDVGSGKTVVAAFSAYVAIKAGYRAVMMAPTEILARQHFKTCSDILSKFDISVGLITASSYQVSGIRYNGKKKFQKPDTKYLIRDTKKLKLAEKADLIVGTHALLQDKIKLENVGLVVVDEQHRFGVKQRQALTNLQVGSRVLGVGRKEKSSSIKTSHASSSAPHALLFTPHFLSMTATPIPRTLYLALFADLDLSVIKTMPKGRKEIKTQIIGEENRGQTYQFIRKQIDLGRQAFVICPLIEEKITNSKSQITNKTQISNSNQISNFQTSNEVPMQESGSRFEGIGTDLADKVSQADLFEQDRKSVIKEFDKLSKNIFPDLRIGMLHGKMPASPRRGGRGPRLDSAKRVAEGGKSKEEVMAKFVAGDTDILVSTSVVEVGVDIPNASIMMIEDAERFGLASLHQFRGRVGRASHQSFCFLFSNSNNPTALNRLRAMEETNDGFKLAEIDLKNRGAGDVFGTLQSGEINLKMALLSDRIMIEKVSNTAKEIISEGIEKYPALTEKLKQLESGYHLE